ncbi:MAG: DUF4167 domain-containing protein [Alphaproteobacteria bacterium]
MRSPQDRRNNRSNNQRRNNNQNRVPVHSRQFESAGPSGKLKGTAKQLIDKYLTLSRDFYSSGDDVKAETCKQFAEHYARLIGFYSNRGQNNNGNGQNQQKNKKDKAENIEKIDIEEAMSATQEFKSEEIDITNEDKPKKRKTQVNKLKTVEIKTDDSESEEEKPKRRGRPKKIIEEAAEKVEVKEEAPKRRGRPKKIIEEA